MHLDRTIRSRRIRRIAKLLGLVLLMGFSATDRSVHAATRLQGAGATFPAPFYKRLVVVYQEMHPDVLIDYQSIGSGGGIRAITDKTVDFCGSDAPMSKKELAAAGGAENIVEFPSCAGGIVPMYNLPGVTSPLKFSGELLADIYLGKVNQVERPGHREPQPRCSSAGHVHHARLANRRLGDDFYFYQLPGHAVRHLPSRSAWASRCSGRSARAAKATKASPPSCNRPSAAWATSSKVTPITIT